MPVGHETNSVGDDRTIDRWTLGAIAIAAWALADMLHEGAGHGGTALLLGIKAKALTSAYFSYADETVSRGVMRLIAAGGSVLNVIVGVPLAFVARMKLPPRWRFFVWLLAAFNLLTAFGYLLYSGIAGIGDWRVVVDDLPHPILWRVGESLLGFVLYGMLAPRLLWPGLAPFVGAGADRVARARRLTLLPYLVAGCTSMASGALNPLGVKLMLISSVAAAFGGASLLAWYFPEHAEKLKAGAPPSLGIARSNAWIAVGAIAFLIFVGVFGRGLTF